MLLRISWKYVHILNIKNRFTPNNYGAFEFESFGPKPRDDKPFHVAVFFSVVWNHLQAYQLLEVQLFCCTSFLPRLHCKDPWKNLQHDIPFYNMQCSARAKPSTYAYKCILKCTRSIAYKIFIFTRNIPCEEWKVLCNHFTNSRLNLSPSPSVYYDHDTLDCKLCDLPNTSSLH